MKWKIWNTIKNKNSYWYLTFSIISLAIVCLFHIHMFSDWFYDKTPTPPTDGEISFITKVNVWTTFGKWGSLLYYTVQINYFIPLFLLLRWLNIAKKDHELIVSGWTSFMFVVYWGLLSWNTTWENKPIARTMDVLVHGVTPGILIGFIVLNRDEVKIDKIKLLLLTISYPILYLLVSLIIYYGFNNTIIYLFLDYGDPMWLGIKNGWLKFITLAFTMIVIVIAFVATTYLSLKLSKIYGAN